MSARGSSLNSLHDYKCLRPIGNEPYNLSNSYIDVGPNALYPNVDWNKHNSNINNVAAVKDYNVDEFIKLEQDFDHDGEVFKMTKETAIDPYNHLSDANFSAWTKPYGVIYDYAGNLGVCPFDDKSVAPSITKTGHDTMGKYGVLIDKTKPVCTFNLVRDEVRETPDDRDYLNDESSWNFRYDDWITTKTKRKFNVLSKEYLSNVNEIAFTDAERNENPKSKYRKFTMQNHDNIWENKNKTGGQHSVLTSKALDFMKKLQKDKKHQLGSSRTMRIWMKDAAGNEGGCSLEFKIDDEPPYQTEKSKNSVCSTKDGSEYYTVCQFQDDESGLATPPKGEVVNKKKYCDPDGGICYRARDNAGNEAFCQKAKGICKKE